MFMKKLHGRVHWVESQWVPLTLQKYKPNYKDKHNVTLILFQLHGSNATKLDKTMRYLRFSR